MELTGSTNGSLEDLAAMQAMKTGALLTASCASGALLAGAPAADVERAAAYGASFGRAFQIVDDILDVVGDTALLGKPVGSDQALGKLTYPSLVGIEASREMAQAAAAEALEAVAPSTGPEAELLRGLARYVVERAS